MYPSQGRFWLAFAGISLTCCLGCHQPPQKTSLGNLPGQMAGNLEPKVNATTYFAYAHLLERQGQFERAFAQYRKALGLRPEFLSARNRLGITLNKLGRNAEASDEFRQAIADHPGLAYLHNNLGFSLYLEGKYAEAQAALDQALELRPDFARAHMNRALVLARLERFDETFSELSLAGNDADACFNMGIILTEADRYADAAHYLETALAARPDFGAARQQLREVSRLAAEIEAHQAMQPALAAETATENDTPQPAEPALASAAAEDLTPEPVGIVLADGTTETATPASTEFTPAAAPIEEATPEVTEPVAEDTTTEDKTTECTSANVAIEAAPAEPVESTPADVTTKQTTPRPAETIWEDAAVPADEPAAEFTAPPLVATAPGPEPEAFAQEPGIDAQLLFVMIDEALRAMQDGADDVESLWCQVSYYLFPETAPDEPFPDADWSADPEIIFDAVHQAAIGK